jgi:hypothetical protein
MKKGKYIDNYVILACLSHKKQTPGLVGINKLLNEAFKSDNKTNHKNEVVELKNKHIGVS